VIFEKKPVDSAFYETRIRDFLPDRIIDIHTHVYLSRFLSKSKLGPERNVTWPSRVATENPIEDLNEAYSLLFPGKKVTPLMFSSLADRADDFEAANAYVSDAAIRFKYPCLLFARPDWNAETLVQKLSSGPFKGIKVYLSLSDPGISDITIYDFLPGEQLEVADKRGLIVMLHIPRNARLKDPVNIAQMREMDERYPDAKIIIAHVGRAYCNEDVGDALKILSKTKNLLFDISANTNAWVFSRLLDAVGPKRVLFGSDLPITRMRMKRITENGRYINLVPEGLYGDVSGDPNMREVAGPESDRFTFFLYGEIASFLETGLSKKDLEDVFFNNANNILGGVK